MLGSTVAATALAAGIVVAPLSAAQADSCVSTITVPDVTVTQSSPGMFDWVNAHWARPCGNTSAKWNAQSNTNGQIKGSWLFTDTAPDQAWPLPYGDNSYLGVYNTILDPSSGDYGYRGGQFAVRFGSRIWVQGYRSGNYVHLRGYVSRFNWHLNNGYGRYQPSKGRTVIFYEHTGGTWKSVGTRLTGSNGYTAYISVYSPPGHWWGDKVLANTWLAGARPSYNIHR
jgi:hypothetical protein